MPAQPSERDREMAQGLAAADPGCRRALQTVAQLIAFARAEGRREGLLEGLRKAAGLIDLGVRMDRAAELPEQIGFLIAEAEAPHA